MRNTKYSKFSIAALAYLAFAGYLYGPYLKNFDPVQYLLVTNVCLGSLGCYVLSRRWVAGFAESFFAGAVYGFGPFSLGLAKFHPAAGLLLAAIPWLFCPAAFCPKAKWQWLQIPLSTLPFLAIPLFFQVCARYRLYPIPIQLKLHPADLAGLLAPLVATQRGMTPAGFYHIPIAALIIGFSMLFAARRYGTTAILAIGTILAFCDSFSNASPIMWLAIPVLCCSVLVGTGMRGLICAGFGDRKWIFVNAVIMGVLAIVTLLLAVKYFQTFLGLGSECARLFAETAKMYLLGAIAVTIIFFAARGRLRAYRLRQALLYSAFALDMFLGARFVVDHIL